MKASEIMLDESLPHGTREGFDAGCKGSHCPGTARLGMTCKQANIRYAGDLSYRRRVDNGLSPEAIAAEDELAGETPTELVDADTRTYAPSTPTITTASSETPLTDFVAVDEEPQPVRKWAVRRLWVAVSPEELQLLHAEGLSDSAIARRMDRAQGMVSKARKSLGLQAHGHFKGAGASS